MGYVLPEIPRTLGDTVHATERWDYGTGCSIPVVPRFGGVVFPPSPSGFERFRETQVLSAEEGHPAFQNGEAVPGCRNTTGRARLLVRVLDLHDQGPYCRARGLLHLSVPVVR